MKKKFKIPIYEAVVWVSFSSDPNLERKKMNHIFSEYEDTDADAICSSEKGVFGLFFNSPSIDVLSHEVFHLTHRIMDWHEIRFDIDNHESFSLLHGYLMKLIYQYMKQIEN